MMEKEVNAKAWIRVLSSRSNLYLSSKIVLEYGFNLFKWTVSYTPMPDPSLCTNTIGEASKSTLENVIGLLIRDSFIGDQGLISPELQWDYTGVTEVTHWK